MTISNEELNAILEASSSEMDPELKAAINELDSSVFASEQSELARQSLKQEGEGSVAYGVRHIADAFERGVVSSADLILPDDFVDYMRDTETRDVNRNYFIPLPTRLMTPEEVTGHRAWIRHLFFDGNEPLPPTGDKLSAEEQAVRFVASGVEGMTDITNLGKTVPQTVWNTAQSFLPSAATDYTIQLTQEALEGTNISPTTKQNILLTLGVGTGVASHTGQQAVSASYKGYKAVKESGARAVGATADTYLKGEQARFAEIVAGSETDFHKFMEHAQQVQSSLGGDKLDIITIAAGLQSDVMKGKYEEFYMSDFKFRQKVDNAITQFNEAQTRAFGELTRSPFLEVENVAQAVAKEQAKRMDFEEGRQKHIQRQIDNIDEKLAETTAKIPATEGVTEVGAYGQKLVNEKISLIKKRLSPMYEEWETVATDSGAVMSTGQVQTLVEHINQLPQNEGRFLRNIPLIGRVVSRTDIKTQKQPSIIQAKSLRDFKEEAPKVTQTVESTYSPKDVKQLKTQVNGRLRELYATKKRGSLTEKGAAELRVLEGFKTTFQEQIRQMPMGKELLEIDKLYYKELGIPTNAAGVSKLSTAEYTDTITRNLLNLTNANNFLSLTGAEGQVVIRDAIYAQLHKLSVKGNDVANEKAIGNWLASADNKKLVQSVDGLEAELLDTKAVITNAKRERARLEQEYRVNAFQSTDDMLKMLDRGGVDSFVASMLKSETRLLDFKRVAKNLDSSSEEMFSTAIREQLVQKALAFRDPILTGGSKPAAVQFMNQHRKVYGDMFGKEYISQLENVFAAYDLVEQVPTNLPFRIEKAQTELFQEATGGMGASGLQSVYRRTAGGLMSTETAAAYGASRIAQGKMNQKKNARLQDVILHPERVAEIARQMEIVRSTPTATKVKAALKKIASVIAASSLRGSYIGAREGTLAHEQESKSRGL